MSTMHDERARRYPAGPRSSLRRLWLFITNPAPPEWARMRWWVPAILLVIALSLPHFGSALGCGTLYLKFERQADGTWLGSGSASDVENAPGLFRVTIGTSARFNTLGGEVTILTGINQWEYPSGLSQRQVNEVASQELSRQGGSRARSAMIERMRNSPETAFRYSSGARWAEPLIAAGLLIALGTAIAIGALRLVEHWRLSRLLARCHAQFCPRCRYQTTGLDSPICPECSLHQQHFLGETRRRLGLAENET